MDLATESTHAGGRPEGPGPWSRAIRALPVAVAVLFIAALLLLGALRVSHPFELEWLEGGCVDHTLRVRDGLALHVPPTLEFVPFIYTPCYFYLSAVLTGVFGEGYLPLRLLSLTATGVTLLLIGWFVYRETASRYAGVVAAGLYAACFHACGAWFDIGRVDSLFLMWVLAACFLFRVHRTTAGAVAAGILMALGFWTKQVAVVIALPVMVAALITRPRAGVLFAATFTLLAGISTVLMNWLSDGWYGYYVFKLPLQHALLESDPFLFWRVDVGGTLPSATFLAAAWLGWKAWQTRVRRADWNGQAVFYAALLAGTFAASWMSRMHVGGYYNVLMPACAALAVVGGLSVGTFEDLLRRGRRPRRVGMVLLAAVILSQFALLRYDPRQYIPTSEDLQAGRELLEHIRGAPGEVFVPYHGYLTRQAGKQAYSQAMAVWDVSRGTDDAPRDALHRDFAQAIENQRFALVILDDDERFPAELMRPYQRVREFRPGEQVMVPVSGMPTRPRYFYQPRRRLGTED